MSDGSLHAAYEKLDAAARHVIQICALSPKVLGRKDVAALSNKSGWKDRNVDMHTVSRFNPPPDFRHCTS